MNDTAAKARYLLAECTVPPVQHSGHTAVTSCTLCCYLVSRVLLLQLYILRCTVLCCCHTLCDCSQVSGMNVVVVVSRFYVRWVLSAIFPILATTWLGFLVFLLPRDDMNGRLGKVQAYSWMRHQQAVPLQALLWVVAFGSCKSAHLKPPSAAVLSSRPS